MASQPQQINTAQLAKMIDNLQKRVDAKTLECASLDQMRRHSAAWVTVLCDAFKVRADAESITGFADSIENYLTAKLNQELVTLEEYEIQLRGWKSALAQMESGILLPSGVKVGRG